MKSILDNDLYKFSMLWAVMLHFPNSKVRYEFILRDKTRQFPLGFDAELKNLIKDYDTISLSKEQRNAFQLKCPFLPNLFFDILMGYRLNPSEVKITQNAGELKISIDGYWYAIILWEIILMSDISELFFKIQGLEPKFSIKELNERDKAKARLFTENDIQVIEFGSRRRYSKENQERVIQNLMTSNKFIGTSNVEMAIKYNLKPIGTYAHEWVCGIAALMGYAHANKHAMELWSQTYNGSLGIALTDSFGLGSFLNDFDMKYAKLFDGVRHDSGDPFKFADEFIKHYKSLGIDPLSKTIVYSDNLNPELCVELNKYCKSSIKTSFGIGTNLSNDVGVKPLNMVIKMVAIDDKHVIKLSDVSGKHTGDSKTIELVKELIKYKPL